MSTTTDPTAEDRPAPTWRTTACGVAMGAADIVPGVSGGTVALVLGVYERLLAAINRLDARFVRLVLGGRFRAAAGHADLGFLSLLVLGVGAGVVGLAGLMHTLLEEHRSLTYAAFFGLIAASGVLVGRLVRPATPTGVAQCWALGIAGAAFAAWLVGLDRVVPLPGLAYTFFCGAVAICAMILPGISGAYLLLILGKYSEITGVIKRAPKLDVSGEELVAVAVFAAGCLAGILAFSRFLKWLLDRHAAATMAVLCGFMVGSLRRVWPFQRDLTPEVEKFKEKVFEPYLPAEFGSDAVACLGVAVVAFAGVLVVDALANRRSSDAPISPDGAV